MMRSADAQYKELATSEEDAEVASEQDSRETLPTSSWQRRASGSIRLRTAVIAIDLAGELHEVWEYNLTFSDKPSAETEAAWNSIVPVGRGFVTHPEVAPFIANIAVFHQMHCLHAIRVAYYVDEHTLGVQAGTAAPDDYTERMAYTVNRKHMRHCFDYLRRALMCGADSNLESVSPDSHVTTGWGDERVCRDYAGVLAWSEQWRNTDDVGIAEPPPDEIPAADSKTGAMPTRHARNKRVR